MERAGIGGLVAALETAEHRAAMAAGIDEGVELAILVAGDEDRLPAHLGGVVVVLLGNLAFVGEVDPVALEDVLHLQFEQALVGEHLALAAEDALLFVVFNERIKVIESQGHGRGLHCYCFYVMKAKALGGASISVFCRTDRKSTRL